MQLTERQINAAIQAIALDHYPNFQELSAQEKTSVGQSAYWWFSRVAASLPPTAEPDTLGADHWDTIKAVAEGFLVGMIRTKNPQHAKVTDEKIRGCIKLTDLEDQTLVFLKLAKVGLAAALANNELQLLVDKLDTMDLNQELEKLLASES